VQEKSPIMAYNLRAAMIRDELFLPSWSTWYSRKQQSKYCEINHWFRSSKVAFQNLKITPETLNHKVSTMDEWVLKKNSNTQERTSTPFKTTKHKYVGMEHNLVVVLILRNWNSMYSYFKHAQHQIGDLSLPRTPLQRPVPPDPTLAIHLTPTMPSNHPQLFPLFTQDHQSHVSVSILKQKGEKCC
jgi:predicted glycosyltransferase involved in capsule biosynthesis